MANLISFKRGVGDGGDSPLSPSSGELSDRSTSSGVVSNLGGGGGLLKSGRAAVVMS